jgi:hypothetical protein
MTMPIAAEWMVFKKIQRFIGIQEDSTWILLDWFLFWSLGFIMLALHRNAIQNEFPRVSDGQRRIWYYCAETWASELELELDWVKR